MPIPTSALSALTAVLVSIGYAVAAVKPGFMPLGADLTDNLVCQGPLGTDSERIYLKEYHQFRHISFREGEFQRTLQLRTGSRERSWVADCRLSDSLYTCQWGWGGRLSLDFHSPQSLAYPGERGDFIVHGEIRSGYFRWPQKVSCRVPGLADRRQEI